MIVNSLILVKSPFDNTYRDVPDLYTPNHDEEQINRAFISYIANYCRYRIISIPNGMSVTPNFNTTITFASTTSDLETQDYNYIILNYNSLDENLPLEDQRFEYFSPRLAFYFIINTNINNSINGKRSATLTLQRDVWVTHYKDIASSNYQTKQMVQRRHTPLATDGEGVRVTPIENPTTPRQFYCGIPNEYDILWLRIKLDPRKNDCYVGVIDENDNVKVSYLLQMPKEYGLVKYFFIPFKMFYSGTPFSADKSVIYAENFVGIDKYTASANMYNTTMGEFDLSSPYILDMDFTFYPPFKWHTEGDGRVFLDSFAEGGVQTRIGYLEIENARQLSKAGVGVIEEANYSRTIRTILSNDLYVFDPIRMVYFAKLTDYITPTYDHAESSQNAITPEQIFNEIEEFKSYPFSKVAIQYPTKLNDLIQQWYHYAFRISIYPKDSGTRYGFEFIEDDGTKDFYRVQTMFSNEGFDSTGSLPLTLNNYEVYRLNNGSRYDVDYQYKREGTQLAYLEKTIDNVTQVGQGLFGMGLTSSPMGALGSGISGAMGLVNQITDTGRLAMDLNYQVNSKNALEQDLQRQCSQVSNISSNAMTDTFFQDRCFVVYYSTIYEPKLDEAILQAFYFGKNVNELSDIRENNRCYYDYILTKGATLPCINNTDDRHIVERIFNMGVTRWHIDKYKSVKLDKNIYNLEVI